MNKKAYMRILEVAIAAVLILSFIYFISMPTYIKKPQAEKEIYKSENEILDFIANSPELRTDVIEKNEGLLTAFAKEELLEKNLDGIVKVCEIGQKCLATALPEKDIYVQDRIIATDLSSYSPKKVVLYAWTLY